MSLRTESTVYDFRSSNIAASSRKHAQYEGITQGMQQKIEAFTQKQSGTVLSILYATLDMISL